MGSDRTVFNFFRIRFVLVSIVIPALNEARCISDTLIALQEQTGPFEIIVVDGGSKDDTRLISSKYATVITSERGPSQPDERWGERLQRAESSSFFMRIPGSLRHALEHIRESVSHT